MDGHEPSRQLELTSQLKHSISFPAIYVTPPRRVLSHGHPSTGTMFSAHALAASYQATGNGFGWVLTAVNMDRRA